jgi:hypothetical protein
VPVGLDGQTGVDEHLHDLLAQVFGIGAGLGLGQLLAQSMRESAGLRDFAGMARVNSDTKATRRASASCCTSEARTSRPHPDALVRPLPADQPEPIRISREQICDLYSSV